MGNKIVRWCAGTQPEDEYDEARMEERRRERNSNVQEHVYAAYSMSTAAYGGGGFL
jgi:hypothetical protein